MSGLEKLLEKMWVDYCQMNPAAKRIYDLFTAEGEHVVNDHIALRTFNHKKLGIKSLAQHFEKYGYKASGEYFFKEKKLYAQHFQHENLNHPKIFISELELEKVSPFIQSEVEKMMSKVDSTLINKEEFLTCGRPWPMTYQTYDQLAKESEYASWVAAYGFRPNHFTVSINHLKGFTDILKLNEFVKGKGYILNSSGGEVKGTPNEYLEQSSTMASEIMVKFDDGSHMIPGAYYEFAKRYPLKEGGLYQGFVAKSADKIFESTNRTQPR